MTPQSGLTFLQMGVSFYCEVAAILDAAEIMQSATLLMLQGAAMMQTTAYACSRVDWASWLVFPL